MPLLAPVERQAAESDESYVLLGTEMCITGSGTDGPLSVSFTNSAVQTGSELAFVQCGKTQQENFNVRVTLTANIFDSSGKKIMVIHGSNPQFNYPFVRIKDAAGNEFEKNFGVEETAVYTVAGNYVVRVTRTVDSDTHKFFRITISGQ